MTLRGGMGIETYRHMGGLLVVEEFDQCIGESELCIGIPSLAGNAWIADQGIIGTKYQRKGIEQEQFLLHGVKVKQLDIPINSGTCTKKPLRVGAALIALFLKIILIQ